MSKQINKNSLIILAIIEIGYFLRGHLPSMCYYTPFLSNYTKYPVLHIFSFFRLSFSFLVICMGILGIKNIKTILKIFGLVQPLKIVTDMLFSFIHVFSEGFY